MTGIVYGTAEGGQQVPLPGPFDRSQAAQHESGHAVVRWALGTPFLKLNLDGPPCPMVVPLPGGTIPSGPAMLVAMAGMIADYQARGLVMAGGQIWKLLAGPGETFELRHPATGEVMVRPSRSLAIAPGADFHYMAARVARDGWTPRMAIAIWRDAEVFTAACRPAIDAVATALIERGELGYTAVSELAAAAVAVMPAPVTPRWVLDEGFAMTEGHCKLR